MHVQTKLLFVAFLLLHVRVRPIKSSRDSSRYYIVHFSAHENSNVRDNILPGSLEIKWQSLTKDLRSSANLRLVLCCNTQWCDIHHTSQFGQKDSCTTYQWIPSNEFIVQANNGQEEIEKLAKEWALRDHVQLLSIMEVPKEARKAYQLPED